MIPAPVGRYIRYWYTYRTVVAVVLALVLSGVIYWLYTQQVACDSHLGGCLVNISVHPEDRLFANQTDPGPNVVIVGIDNKAAQAIGSYPFTRSVYATALQNLEKDGALTVGFDVEFADPRDAKTDGLFASALANSTIPVVLSYPAADLRIEQGKVVQAGPPAAVDQIPLKAFRCLDANTDPNVPCQKPDPNVVLASPDLVLDSDGVVRRIPIFVQPACYSAGTCNTPLIDTFGFAAFRASQPDFKSFPEPQESGGTATVGTGFSMSVDAKGAALIDYSGPPNTFVLYSRYVSLADVLSGAAPADMF